MSLFFVWGGYHLSYNLKFRNNTFSLHLFFFLSTGKGLTQLDVSQNQLQNVPSSALKNLHHLLILNLNHNKISVVHNRAFEGLDTLEILTLYENKIVNIEPDAFRGLDKWVFKKILLIDLGFWNKKKLEYCKREQRNQCRIVFLRFELNK